MHEIDGVCLLSASGHRHPAGAYSASGKIAAQAGIPPAMWTFLFSASAGVILFAVLLLRGKSLGFSGGRARYYVCTAIISYALPNLLILSAIPRLGAGFTGIMYTLSPVITLVISMGFGLRRPNALGIGGIVVGFIGAILVALTRGEVGKPADSLWVAAALLIPVFLACGNVYRTLDWPKNSDPTELAAGSHLASAIMLFAGILLFTGGFPVETFALAPWAATAQAIASAECSRCSSGYRQWVDRFISARSAMWPQRSVSFPARCFWASIIRCLPGSAQPYRGWRGDDHARPEKLIAESDYSGRSARTI